jgi:hypothetical protein
MKKTFRLMAVLATATGLLGVTAASAGAASLAPTNHNFGNQAVGTTSAATAFTILNGCMTTNPIGGGCLIGQFTSTGVGVTGEFAQTNNCPLLMTTDLQTCTINVTFVPTGAGPRAGSLNTGAGSATLSGTGTVSPAGGVQGVQGTSGGKKKCKKGKKHSAAAAKKKCGKKKK